eukprot:XP_011667130.1 PREDICTED: uncharacterized protein LOC764748 isoform X4 [Strongylocentrotus purpuratus]
MPGVRCPIKNCSYVTPDDVLHLELIIALLQLHGKEHDQPAYATKKVECPTLSASEASGSGDVAAVIKSSDPQPHRKERDQPADATKKCTTSSPSEALDCDASGSGDVHEVPSKSSATSASHCLVTSEPTMKGSVSSPPPSDDVVHVQSVTNTTAVHLLPWPVKFRIPKEKFRASLVRALGECRPLTASEKEKLMDSLYDAVTRYTYRPKPVQYTEVISCLLTSYPALKNGLVGQDAMGYWKKSLSNRFRNSRKRHERDNPLAQMGKKTRVTTKPDQPSKQMYMHPQQKKSPSVTASSSDKATHLQTMQQNTSVTSKSNTGVNEGTMTELTWIELPRKLVQSKDASTQWEQQPPTHSTQAASTSSTQDLDKPSCGDDGELEQDGLGWCSEDTPAVQEDEFMDSSEPSDVHIDGSIIVAGSRGHVEETTVVESQEGKQSKTPILRRMIDELIDEEVDYQTVYVKEEYFEDECQDDDYAHVHLTPGGHPRLDAESPRSTQQTNSDRAPRQNGGPCIGSKKSPNVTASSSDKATHLQTMQQNTSVTSKSYTGVNEGTMTDLTWIELLRKLVQSKDASTQWEQQPPTHSTQAASTSSTQDLDKPSCGDDGELEQDGLGWSSQDTPAVQEDEFMDSSEPSDLHIDLSTIVAGYRGFEEETTVAESQEGEQNNSPILRRIKEEMIDEFEEGDYQTLYVKEEYLEDECQDDDYAHVHLTPGKASHKHMVVQYMLLPNVLTQTECLARP